MTKLAWAGELLMLEARWTDKDGHTVKLQLVTPNEERPNPFKAFTKRRSGRAGTRFKAVLKPVDEIDGGYDGELMLAGWGDSSTQGYTVSFWCEPQTGGQHPFAQYTRHASAFMCALVELDDDDQPIDQEKRERVEAAAPPEPPKKPLRDNAHNLSKSAAMLCDNPEFWKWCDGPIPVVDPTTAAQWIRSSLGIASRAELDTNPEVAQRYHRLIRIPFANRNGAYA